MSWTNNVNSRSSIFETFHSPNFGDETLDVNTESSTTGRHFSGVFHQGQRSSSASELNEVEAYCVDDEYGDDMQFEMSPAAEDENEESMATLWMSCSPGRDTEEEEEEEEEGEGEEPESDDEDDLVPLSQLQTSKFYRGAAPSAVSGGRSGSKKKSKPAKKRKKKEKDPNAPKKSMSAYSLFFRDTQASIKTQNPQASFGDVSRIVASMWESLEPREKEKYNSQAEKDKRAYVKALADYEAGKTSNTRPSKHSHKQKQKPESPVVSDDDSEKEKTPTTSSDEEWTADKEEPTAPPCTRTDCKNSAVDDPQWDFDFCSSKCVVSHCRDVFTAWVASRQSTKVE